MVSGRRKEINDTVAKLQRHIEVVLTNGLAPADAPSALAAAVAGAAVRVGQTIQLDDLEREAAAAEDPLPITDRARYLATSGNVVPVTGAVAPSRAAKRGQDEALGTVRRLLATWQPALLVCRAPRPRLTRPTRLARLTRYAQRWLI